VLPNLMRAGMQLSLVGASFPGLPTCARRFLCDSSFHDNTIHTYLMCYIYHCFFQFVSVFFLFCFDACKPLLMS